MFSFCKSYIKYVFLANHIKYVQQLTDHLRVYLPCRSYIQRVLNILLTQQVTATCLLYKRFGYNQNRYGKKIRILANTFCSLTSTIIYTLALVKASKRLHSYATARSKQQELGLVLTNRERKIIDTMAARKNMLLMASSAAASGHRCEGGTELAA